MTTENRDVAPDKYADTFDSLDEFLDKMEYEGGIGGMLSWGGADYFPPEIRLAASRAEDAIAEIDEWIEANADV